MKMGIPPSWWPPETEQSDAQVRFSYGRAVMNRVRLRRELEAAELEVKELKAEMRARGLLPNTQIEPNPSDDELPAPGR